MFVTLSESLHFHKEMVVEVQKTMKSVFPVVDLYTAPLATYAGNWWTFSVGSKKLDPQGDQDARTRSRQNTTALKYTRSRSCRRTCTPNCLRENSAGK